MCVPFLHTPKAFHLYERIVPPSNLRFTLNKARRDRVPKSIPVYDTECPIASFVRGSFPNRSLVSLKPAPKLFHVYNDWISLKIQ